MPASSCTAEVRGSIPLGSTLIIVVFEVFDVLQANPIGKARAKPNLGTCRHPFDVYFCVTVPSYPDVGFPGGDVDRPRQQPRCTGMSPSEAPKASPATGLKESVAGERFQDTAFSLPEIDWPLLFR